MNANYNLPERGLTVLELIFVGAIVAVLVGIAVPPMLEARRSAQETRAVANLRMVSASQMLYFANRNQFASFEMLFSGGILSEGQFERGAAGGGPKGATPRRYRTACTSTPFDTRVTHRASLSTRIRSSRTRPPTGGFDSVSGGA